MSVRIRRIFHAAAFLHKAIRQSTVPWAWLCGFAVLQADQNAVILSVYIFYIRSWRYLSSCIYFMRGIYGIYESCRGFRQTEKRK